MSELLYMNSLDRILNSKLSNQELLDILNVNDASHDDKIKLIDLLLWWGFFGVFKEQEEVSYIYDVQYNMNRLKALLSKCAAPKVFQINPAFWTGLDIKK